jgi:2-polyprenyl-3-methyl-5-hydroxy-6-metoxy-1,4-benzoquinol methylase
MNSTVTSTQIGERLSEAELCPHELLAGQEAAFARDIELLQRRANEFVTVACPACEGSRHSPAFKKYGFSFSSCADCRTLYMNPRPSPALMADYYANSENYAYFAAHIFPASEESRKEKVHRPRLAKILEYCARFAVPRGTLLEVGPGFGTFAEVATKSEAFGRVVAIEPTPEMAAACRARGVEIIEKRVEDVARDVNNADVVVSFEVIEHLFEPAEFVEQCGRLIPAGGLLVLTCPNGLGFDVAMLGADSLAVDAEHVNLFNPSSLSRLVERAGFEVLEVSTPGRLDAELVRDVAMKGGVRLDPFLKRVLLDEWDTLGWSFQQYLAASNLSSHMWLVARKR